MLALKQLKIFSLLLSFFLTFFNGKIISQNETKEIALIFPLLSYTEPYGNITYKKIKNYYQSRGYKIDQFAEKALIVITADVQDIIVLSIFWTRALPKSVIEFNVKNEIFYIDHPGKDTLSSEGKVVREYLTREFLYDYRRIQDASISMTAILSKDNFESELKEFIAKNL